MSGFPYLARNGCGAELRLGIFTNEADEQEQLQEACSLNRLDLPSRSSSSLVSGPRSRPMSMPMPMHMPRSSSSATAAITAMAAPVQLDLLPLHGRLRSRNRESSPSASTPMALPWMRASSSPSPSPWPGSAELGEMRLQHGQSSSSGRGIDMNQVPSFAEDDEVEATVSSPNSTVSSFQMDAVSGNPGSASRSGSGSHSSSANNNNNKNNNSRKRERDECNADAGVGDNEQDRACSRASDEEEGGDATRKKLRLSKEQSALLEESFKEHNTLNPKQKLALAKQLNLRPRQVEVWFQNRRARTKLKQTEVDCEFLKRCCENLTEENRRLQKEVQELRALKMATPLYMQMPAATLTMCPSCERIATATADTHRAQAQAQAQAQPPTNHIQRRTPWQAALVPNTSRAFQSSVRS